MDSNEFYGQINQSFTTSDVLHSAYEKARLEERQKQRAEHYAFWAEGYNDCMDNRRNNESMIFIDQGNNLVRAYQEGFYQARIDRYFEKNGEMPPRGMFGYLFGEEDYDLD